MLCNRRRTRQALTTVAVASTLLTLGGLSGCTDKVSSGGGNAADSGMPKKLIFGFVPSTEADKIAEDAQPMADYLSKKLGVPVETYTSTGYSGLIEAMASGKVDIGSLPPLAYVLAKDRNAAEVLLKTKRHGAITYHTMFITRADSGIKSILDAKGKRMAWVDPDSTSGYLIPSAYLKGKGIDPNTFFSQMQFAGSHDGAVRAIYDGDEDVAAVYDDARNKLLTLPAYKDVKTKVLDIGHTGEIPNDTISVREGLNPDLVAKIKQALLDYADDPQGKKTLEAVYEVDGVVPALDSDYDPVRQVAKAMDIQFANLDKKKTAASPAAAGASPAVAAKPAPSASASPATK